MPTANYIKNIDDKYLVSGPAPIGRILNYLKRIEQGQYKTSKRGNLSDADNLDNWTICFMVGLGIVSVPSPSGLLTLSLTKSGKTIYQLIKGLPDFQDIPNQGKQDMLHIKAAIKANHMAIYQKLKETLLNSPPLINMAIFFRKNNVLRMNRQVFYKEFGKIFSINTAGFNRLPSFLHTLSALIFTSHLFWANKFPKLLGYFIDC